MATPVLDHEVNLESPDTPSRRLTVVKEERPRYGRGWRRDKPIEDPNKTKSWGFITAKPSEFLIHMRRGRVLERSTGQGASCFKRPWDSVAIVPTTINRLQFAADQVTLEKVGVEVLGLAVFRIVDPLQAYRMLNFSFTERASEKLEEILGEMFVGATRRLVANLTVEEALTQRKDALAAELMREIAPVVSGHARVDDETDGGWGVVIDTIEIQDVRILSEKVFTNMQSEFRADLERRAREAKLEAAKSVALREAANQHAIAEARITSDVETRELKARGESRAAEIEVAEQTKREEVASQLAREQIERKRAERAARIEAEADVETRTAELIELRQRNARLQHEMKLALELLSAQNARETKLVEVEAERSEGEMHNALLEARRAIENTFTEDRIRMALVQESLPAIASALAHNFGEVHLTQIGADGTDPAALLGGALKQLLDIARASGITLDRSGE